MVTKSIGHESSLHVGVKEWYWIPGDQIEDNVQGYIIDIVRDGLLIEIQIGHFYKIKHKLKKLMQTHRVRLVYPIAINKWIARYNQGGFELLSRRKSPKHNQLANLFDELIYLPRLPLDRNFSMEILMIEQEDVWVNDQQGSWRRKKWSISDRKLLAVLNTKVFTSPGDYLALLPPDLPTSFSSQDIALRAQITSKLARKMLYCLLHMELIRVVGKVGNSIIYSEI